MQDTQGSYVYVIKDGKAKIARVSLGQRVDTHILVNSGLKEGDVLILNQLSKIRDDSPVTPDSDSQSGTENNAQN